MTEENLKKYFEIYTDYWKLFRKYSELNDTEEFWKKLDDESRMLYKKHGKSEFSKALLIATVSEVDRIGKSKRNR